MSTAQLELVTQPSTKEGPTEEMEIRNKATTMLERANQLLVVDNESFALADAMLGEAATFMKKAKAFCAPFKEAANTAHKAAVQQEKDLCSPYEEVRAILNPRCQEFKQEMERKEQEERRRLEVAARKRAEDEALAAAAHAKQEGNTEEAEAILNAPLDIAPIVVPTLTPKTGSFGLRENWEIEVVDVKALAKAVAEGSVPSTFIDGNASNLKKQANVSKGEFRVPGVRAFRKDIPLNKAQRTI